MRIGDGGASFAPLDSSSRSLATLLRICDLTIDVPSIQSVQLVLIYISLDRPNRCDCDFNFESTSQMELTLRLGHFSGWMQNQTHHFDH